MNEKTLIEQVATLSEELAFLTREVGILRNESAGGLADPRFNPFSQDILNQSIFFPVSITYYDTSPQSAGTYSIMFTADRECEVISFSESHGTACSSTGTLQLEKCPSGTAPDSGTALLTAALALNTTANTPQYGVLGTKSLLGLKRGDRLVLKDAGTLTALKDLNATVWLRRV